MNPLKRASLLTLGVIFSFVLFVVIIVGLYSDTLSLPSALILTIGINFLMWFVSPAISDVIYKWFYKVKFYSPEEFAINNPELAAFVGEVSKNCNFKTPKIGIIDDGNPTAFTYGSTKNRARIIFTSGLSKYLSVDEVKAVLAHELGHIHHNDFVVMTMATTMAQILYEIYVFFAKSKKSDDKKGNLAIIGWISYIFYWISSYLILFLSRTREYYADAFSVEITKSPELLAQALIKVAYGLVQAEDSNKTDRLLGSTRALGVMDFKSSKGLGTLAFSSANAQLIGEVMAFDLVSPWAWVLEISSTHPLTGKRILALEKMMAQYNKSKFIDFESIIQGLNIDRSRLNKKFAFELCLYFLPVVAPIIGLFIGGLSGAILLLAIAILIKVNYQMGGKDAQASTVVDELRNVYASPMKGHLVKLEGQVVGKGIPGYAFSEDIMLKDNSGLTYIDYTSAFGFIGNFFFALRKVKKIMGQQVSAEGWFFRGIGHSVALRKMVTPEKQINSHPKLASFIGVAILLVLAFVFISL